MTKAKILMLDIETSPNTAHVWSLWKQNVGLSQLMDSSRTMCFAAKWFGQKGIEFTREKGIDKNQNVVDRAWELLDEADIVVHFNGKKFDIPTLNKEFLLCGYVPPSPYKQIDLLQVTKQQFRFPSNKLDYVAKALGLKGKVKHIGHELWVKCMAGDESAWKEMERYNKKDVALLEEVYDIMLPWISNHPNLALYLDEDRPVCTNCGSKKVWKNKDKFPLNSQAYTLYQCQDCGTWIRSRYTTTPKEQRQNILTQVK